MIFQENAAACAAGANVVYFLYKECCVMKVMALDYGDARTGVAASLILEGYLNSL